MVNKKKIFIYFELYLKKMDRSGQSTSQFKDFSKDYGALSFQCYVEKAKR
jgi:hypothetical protein